MCDDGSTQEVIRPNISGINLPTTLYRLRLCDGTEVYIFEDALQNITGTYYIVQEIEIIDLRQLFQVTDNQGIQQTLTLEQLLNFVLNSDNITINNYQHNDGSCEPTPPDCTPEEQQDQQNALLQIMGTGFAPTDSDDINFPTTLQRILLCDGTEVYLFPDELAQIPGTYTILQTIDVTNAQQLFDRGNTITNLDLNDLFCVGLYYAASNPGYSTPPRKNGDIAWMTWQTKGRETQAYSFRYDNLNRLTKAFHSYIDNNMDYTNNQHYDVSLTYDANGNIMNLSRKRMPINGTACGIDMDVLTYDYDIENEGNRLLNILDEGETNKGFKYLEGAANYNYDLNGNLIEDFHKDLTISYNYLNLAELVSATDGTIDWLYNADGVKHRKIVTGSNGYVKDYCNGIEYKDGALEAIYHDEGRVVPNGSGGYFYDYILRDHLGNTRVMFRDADNDGVIVENEILSEAHYYPFGEELVGDWNRTTTPALNYLYNNKELDSDFGLKLYHYGTRLYDPIIGRFTGTDLIAEKFPWVTTYNYAENSPIANIDLHGLQALHYGATSSYTGEGQKFVENNPKTAAAIAIGFVAAPVLAVAGAEAGPAAVGSFLLNEVKDEALSQATGGASDVLDLTKGVSNLLKNLAEKIDNVMSKESMSLIKGGSLYSKGKVDEFSFARGHEPEIIENSHTYKTQIRDLSDNDLIKTLDPDNPNWEPITVKRGVILRGNNRLYEVQKRGLDVEFKYRDLYDDNSNYFYDY